MVRKPQASKLFNLKEWLTLDDAAKHLSIVFGEEVTRADILRLAAAWPWSRVAQSTCCRSAFWVDAL